MIYEFAQSFPVAVTGATGQLGSDIVKVFNSPYYSGTKYPILEYTRSNFDLCDYSMMLDRLATDKPLVLINTAAAVDVNECENNPNLAYQLNTLSVYKMAKWCRQLGIRFVHISTDYVFGQEPRAYDELARPNPTNVYGLSKAAGEEAIKASGCEYLIIRTCGLFGINGAPKKGGNFVERMLKKKENNEEIKVVNDQYTCPTYTLDLAKYIKTFILSRINEPTWNHIRHVCSPDYCSWYEFAKEIVKPYPVTNIQTTGNLRPYKSRIESLFRSNNNETWLLNIVRPWKESLKTYLEEMKQYSLYQGN